MSIIKKAFDYTINLFNAREELNDSYAKYLEIRRFTQIDWYSCGIQCAYTILDYFDLLARRYMAIIIEVEYVEKII